MAQLDPSIILQAGKSQGIDPGQLLEQRAQVQLRNLAVQQQQRAEARQAKADADAERDGLLLKDVGARAATGDVSGARAAALGAGKFELVKQLDSMGEDQRKRAFEISQHAAPILAHLSQLAPDKQAAAVQQAAPMLQEAGWGPQQLAELQQNVGNPAWFASKIAAAQTIAEYNAQKDKDRSFGLEQDKFGYQQTHDKDVLGVQMRGQDMSHADSAASRAVTMRGQDMTQANMGKAPGDKSASLVKPSAAITEKYIGNNQSIRNIDRAWTELSSYPKAVGAIAYLPDAIIKRTDPKGVAARAAVANIGSLIVHDRSGAAVTIAEMPRLAPFVPQVTDDVKTVKTNLRQLRSALTETQDDFDSVYAGLPKLKPAPSAPKKPPPKGNGDVDAILRKHGVIK